MEKLFCIVETKIENQKDFDDYWKSEFLYTLGNIYRKMEMNDKAIEKLRLSDLVVQDLDEHNYPSLILIAEILNQQGVSSSNLDMIQQAVDQARLVKELMETNGCPHIFRADILLASLLYNLCHYRSRFGVQEKDMQNLMKESYMLAKSGSQGAMKAGDKAQVAKAAIVMNNFDTRKGSN